MWFVIPGGSFCPGSFYRDSTVFLSICIDARLLRSGEKSGFPEHAGGGGHVAFQENVGDTVYFVGKCSKNVFTQSV